MKKILLTTTKIILITNLFFWVSLILTPSTQAQSDQAGCCEVTGPNPYVNGSMPKDECQGERNGYKYNFHPNQVVSPDGKSCVNDALKVNNNLPNLKLNAPDIKVSIPGADKLQPVTCTETSCSIPWLAEYIASLQKYAIGIIGILAAITIMIGGIVWLTAAGNSNQVSSAKKWITGGLSGLVLVLGSYLLLSIINPKLTVLNNLNLTRIGKIDLDELIQGDHEPDFDPNNAKLITDTTYDETFKNFAACIGVDWRILKGIAFKESGLNADSHKNNDKKKYKGLFQTRQEYCIESVKRIGLSSDFCKAGVFDPAVNTAIATGMMKGNLATINSKCGSSGNGTKIFLIYFGHSSGGGALANAISDYGCNIDKWPDSNPPFVGATKKYVTETVETVLAQGVDNIQNTSENKQCPKK